MSCYFSKDDILLIHSKLIDDFGGSDGIRDEGMQDSAINTPLQTFDSSDLYPTDIDKITRLSFGLVMDHPFIDGNKRIGAHAMLVFLALNDIEVEYEDAEFIKLVLDVAAGEISAEQLLAWLQAHIC